LVIAGVPVGVCPAAPLVVPRLQKKNARSGLTTLAIVVIASVLAPLLVPPWLAILDSLFAYDLSVAPSAVPAVIFWKVLLPLAAGMIVGRFSTRVAKMLAPICVGIVVAALALVVVALLRVSIETMHLVPLRAVAALVLTTQHGHATPTSPASSL
jgi:predicted Na+-dependent transporter